MSIVPIFRDALRDALTAHAPLADGVNTIDAVPARRATTPFVELGPIELRDWSTKTERGRELRFVVSIAEQDDHADRLAVLMAECETAIAAMPRGLSGWQLVSCVLLRGRIDRSATPWRGILTFRARLLAQ